MLSTESGSTFLISMFILLAMGLLAITSFTTSDVEMTIAGNSVRRTQALMAADAGLARADYVFTSNPRQYDSDTLTLWINSMTDLPNASFSVSMDKGFPLRTVSSFGSAEDSKAAIQVSYRHAQNPYNVWNNAIFAGHGQDGMSIRGNTGVHGSVHILGNGEPYDDLNGNGTRDAGEPFTDANHDGNYDAPLGPGDVALDMTGTALISNNYQGLDPVLAWRVPALETTPYGGEDVQTLFAEVRVQHGRVELDGNAKIGQPNRYGEDPAIKEPMDATWVTDGFGGSAANDAVFADNGYDENYDLDDYNIVMPNLDEPFTDKNGVEHSTYMDYLRSDALVVPGDLEIRCGQSLPLLSNGTQSLYVDAFGNMQATGVVYIEGDLVVHGDCPLSYDGRFTLVSEGNVSIDADMYSKGKFALDDVMGVISHGKITLGDDASQLRLAGAFFAQEAVQTNKQTQIAGSIVSNYFDLRQVPDIFQVPLLSANLPPRMPGSDDVVMYAWRLVPKSWTELY
jgi:hypothetical protein